MRDKLKKKLIERVVEHIKKDIEYGDITAVVELLDNVSKDALIAFLPEEEYDDFDYPNSVKYIVED